MANAKAGPARPLNNAILVFKGLHYRYNARKEAFRLLDGVDFVRAPEVVTASGTRWYAGGHNASTPLEALKAWCQGLTELRAREALEAQQSARDLRLEVRQLRARTWR